MEGKEREGTFTPGPFVRRHVWPRFGRIPDACQDWEDEQPTSERNALGEQARLERAEGRRQKSRVLRVWHGECTSQKQQASQPLQRRQEHWEARDREHHQNQHQSSTSIINVNHQHINVQMRPILTI